MKQKFSNILFTDIETTPSVEHFSLLGERGREVFEKKFKRQLLEKSEKHTGTKEEALSELWQDHAALHAEFNRIVSVGFGYFALVNKDLKGDALWHSDNVEFKVKTMVSKDEVATLNESARIMRLPNFSKICGHNFNDFDGPMYGRRMMVNQVPIPDLIATMNKKNWDLPWIDTMKIWACHEWGSKISLDRLCYALDVPTPKADMDGSQVKDLYYGAELPDKETLPFGKYEKEEFRFQAIGKYQAGDIVALANVFLRLNNENVIPEEKIKYV